MFEMLEKLNPEQYEAATTIEGPLLMLAGAGTGKALLNGTGVLTAHGYVAIESLKVGDQVFGRDGLLHNVIGVFPQGKKEVVEVTFSDRNIIKCCEDHLWTYQTASRRDKKGKWETAPLKEIEKMDLQRKRGQWQRNNIYIPMCEPIDFPHRDVPLPPYLLGALLGDGGLSARYSIKFSNIDTSVLDRVSDELRVLGCTLKYRKGCDYAIQSQGRGKDSPILERLRGLKLLGTHSDTKFIPDIYKYNDIQTRFAVLQGLIDTDGHAENSNYEFVSVSKQLTMDVQFLCESLGMTAVLSEKETTYIYNGERKQGKRAYRLYIKTRENIPHINYTSRKKLTTNKTHGYAHRHIVKIEHTGRYEDMTCIKVDSEDSLFITEHCIVTHNTHTMTCRSGNMIYQGIAPENILMLTFTNKAAREMKDRIGRFLGEDVANRLTASTFHSFCVMMLRKFHKVANLDPNFTVLSSSDDEDIISMVKSSEDKQRYSGRGFPPNGKVCSFISASINKNISIAQAMKDTKYEHFYAEVEELKEKADEYKRLNQCLNYDDLLVRFIEVLQHKPTAQRIAATYQYIMVDEYQDTNPLQDKILLALFEFTKNIAVVGDDLQSLYGFRGADVQNIIRFPEKFQGCKTITLVRNYRSCQEVLDLSNKITLCATEGTPKQLIGQYHSGNKPVVLSVADQHDEADRVLQIIRKCESSGIPLEDICIVERNSLSSAEIEVKLKKEGYEFDKYGGSKFVDLSYVKDILAYLKLMTNPYDEISWFRILQLHAGIGNVNARKIANGCKEDGFKHLQDKKYTRRQYGVELEGLYNQLVSCEKLKLTELITSFIDFYVETSRRNIQNMKTDEANRTLYNLELDAHADDLKKLIDIAAPYRSIDSFLDDLLLDNTKVDEVEDNKGHIVISTIHSVKGLEYDTVIMLDCLDEIFPKYDEVGDAQYNEELRCFYVAVTRAKTKLFIMCPKSANRFGQPIAGIPSHYLKETSGLLASNDKYFFDRFVEKDVLDDYFGGWPRYNRYF